MMTTNPFFYNNLVIQELSTFKNNIRDGRKYTFLEQSGNLKSDFYMIDNKYIKDGSVYYDSTALLKEKPFFDDYGNLLQHHILKPNGEICKSPIEL